MALWALSTPCWLAYKCPFCTKSKKMHAWYGLWRQNLFKVPNFVTLLSLCDEKFVTKIVHLASWFTIIYKNLIMRLVNNIVAYWYYCHIIVCTTIFVLCVKSEKVCTIIIILFLAKVKNMHKHIEIEVRFSIGTNE
jgi:hypothetical protein